MERKPGKYMLRILVVSRIRKVRGRTTDQVNRLSSHSCAVEANLSASNLPGAARKQLLENLSRKDVAPIRGSPYNLMAYDIVLHNFRSSLYKRGPLGGRFNSTFPRRLCPRERRCSRRPKRGASSVAPKPAVTSSKDRACHTSRTRSSFPSGSLRWQGVVGG